MSETARQSANRVATTEAGPLRPASRTRRPTPLLDAQAALGNALVQRRLLQRALQRQALEVAPPEDEHEQEAERLADRLTEGLAPPPMPGAAPEAVWRAAEATPAPEEKKEEPEIARAAAAAEPEKKKEEPAIATKADAGSATPQVTPAVTDGIAAGGGRSLPGESRGYFEPRLGSDLSGVRVHDDASAASAASDLGARAFTYGRDVFFGAGRYQPHTSEGQKLLAHELVHTVQQRPGGALSLDAIQRQTDPPPPGGSGSAPAPTAAETGGIARTLGVAVGQLEGETEKRKIHFAEIEVPPFKAADHRGVLYDKRKPLNQVKDYDRGEPNQRDVWRRLDPGPDVLTRLRGIHKQEPAPGQPWLFKGPGSKKNRQYFLGDDLLKVAKQMNIPGWDRSGDPHDFQVDHIVELQLAGWTGTGPAWANTPKENLELLDSSANASSGSTIKGQINRKLNAFLEKARGDPEIPDKASKVKREFPLEFDAAVGTGKDIAVGPDDFWTYDEIFVKGAHLEKVDLAHLAEVGKKGSIKVFGSAAQDFAWGQTARKPEGGERDYLSPFDVTDKEFRVEPEQLADPVLGLLTLEIPSRNRTWEASGPHKIEVRRTPGLPYAGSIDHAAVLAALTTVRMKGLSPIEVDPPEVVPDGLYVTGRVLPDLPALRGGIDFELRGDDFRLYKELSLGDVELPKPFAIEDITVVLGAGTKSGLKVSGQIDFAIERVGRGYLGLSVGTSQTLEVDGGFDFDTRLFKPATMTVRYADGAWSGSGVLGIPPGKVPGIRRAQVQVKYSEGRLEADGTAELTVPGVEEGSMSLTYSEAEGLAIGGKFQLKNDIPGIRGGQIEARVQERPEQGDYRVTARGQAEPAIPGIDSQLSVEYDDGAITIQADAAYARTPVSGKIRVGATNRPVDEAGNPVLDAAPTERLQAYGTGTVTVQLAPWLQGTVGVTIHPDGELELAGEIALPSTVELFPVVPYEKTLKPIGFDIPIVGVSVLGKRIGIYVNVSGGLGLRAGVGPGYLDLRLGVEKFNPERPEETHVTGAAKFRVPAFAEVSVFVRGALGAGIPIVSAEAGLTVTGTVGVRGEAGIEPTIDWTPARGLVLDAPGYISLEPVFRFTVTGDVSVIADLWFDTWTLYENKWDALTLEYGPKFRLGMRFPVHYEEGRPFDIAWSAVQFETPDIDARSVLIGLVKEIV